MRDWLYVGDHCTAIDLVVRHGRDGEVYNIGGHNERTNLEVVRTILAALGKPESLITYVKDRPGHDLRYAMDPTKIETELGWKPKHNFDTGIRETIRWNLENAAWLSEREFLKRQGADLVFFPYTQSTSSTRIKSLIQKKLL